VLPPQLLTRYREAQEDPELLSHRADVALLEARLRELTERLSDGESGQLWRDLRKAVAEFDGCRDADEQKSVMMNVRELVQRGAADEEVWRQLHDVIEQKTKVASSEWKRLVDMRQVITAEKAIAFSMQLLEVVLRHTPEEDRRRRIAGDIQQLMLVGGGEGGSDRGSS
jgi:hypothetical protein